MRKALLLCLLFALPVFAQSVSVTKSNGVFTFTNTGNKQIVLIVGDLTFEGSKAVMPFAHESIFKQSLTKPGAAESFEDSGNLGNLAITFVQFADGSTWGDPNGSSAQYALARRRAALAYLPTLANAGTEAGFVLALNQSQADPNAAKERRRYQADLATGGAAVAWANAKARWGMAQSRSSLWNF